MKKYIWILVTVLMFASMQAEAARRLGGGGSMGRQSSNVTQREATRPSTPANPSQSNQAAPAAPAGAGAAAAAQAPRRPWGAMLGGLAAGLGLAWLAHSLGLGAAFGQFLMIALLLFVAVAVIGFIMRSRRPAASQPPYAFEGAGGNSGNTGNSADTAAPARGYSPDKVGNDSSARPWERNSMAFEPGKLNSGSGLQIGSALGGAAAGSGLGASQADPLAGSQNWGVPAGFDADGFLTAAKRNFVTLQDAWDRSDIASLRSMMTDEMLSEIRSQLAERERQQGGQTNKTEVVMIEATLLGIEDLGNDYMASVEFSGMIREEPSAGPSPFREVWNMTKPKSGQVGWLVAGVQALQ